MSTRTRVCPKFFESVVDRLAATRFGPVVRFSGKVLRALFNTLTEEMIKEEKRKTYLELLNMVGFEELQVRETGLDSLKDAGITPYELFINGATVNDLLRAGFTMLQLYESGVPIRSLLDNVQTVQDLINSGITIPMFLANNWSLARLYFEGITVTDFRDVGISFVDLYTERIPMEDMVRAGLQRGYIEHLGVSDGRTSRLRERFLNDFDEANSSVLDLQEPSLDISNNADSDTSITQDSY